MSKLYKSSDVISVEDLKRLEWYNRYVKPAPEQTESPGPSEETLSLRDQILDDAEHFANQRLQETGEQIEAMYADAQAQIDQWWLERRLQDDETLERIRQDGYQLGFQEGKDKAEAHVHAEWETMLTEARAILDSSFETKEQIIQEAEPFVVALSTAIAEKIIQKQLTIDPQWSLDIVRKALERRREQGVITLCVSPGQLAYVQAAREELSLAIDSQAELQIVPDVTVKSFGCVIRSSFGSIDARIDTQLSEIKRELIQLALQAEERGGDDEN
ncbi:FliH/SctL family protein [Paenibacillus sacheonensis]|uniref:Flagellar assembly protein FliH n=1 Tax=Paenibacillus sacheonensis TaxID=742054 RepID=A0A7X5BY62_9BACL|nr:FliH/SctL family protein [Paenibacillus sacheonensis]MBM7564609.1 flagellar assembly protein FliH [Paenibacillus sacheonensis]NBC69166.1 flagellar assembly protein FliH [Paenibacillus sacheonensis]